MGRTVRVWTLAGSAVFGAVVSQFLMEFIQGYVAKHGPAAKKVRRA